MYRVGVGGWGAVRLSYSVFLLPLAGLSYFAFLDFLRVWWVGSILSMMSALMEAASSSGGEATPALGAFFGRATRAPCPLLEAPWPNICS